MVEIIESILDINFDFSINKIATLILPVSTTLLGLVYAAFIYWLQGGFTQLEFSKSILEDLLISNFKILLDLLVTNSVICLLSVFELIKLQSLTFWLFSLIYAIDILKSISEQGYIITLNSKKFIPAHYGTFREFLRKLRNSGMQGLIRFMYLYLPVVIYPILVSSKGSSLFNLNETSIMIFIFVTTLISLLQIKSLITEAFETKKDIEKNLLKENQKNAMSMGEKKVVWSTKKINIENKIIIERLERIGIYPVHKNPKLISKVNWDSRDLGETPVLEFDVHVKKEGSLHLNIIIPYLSDDEITRTYIFNWSRKIFSCLAKSKTDVNFYSLSYFRKDKEYGKIHLALFRASRQSIINANEKLADDESFIKSLEGKYLSFAVAEV